MGRLVLVATVGITLLGASLAVAAASTGGARAGMVYVGHPFPDDPFELKVSANARSASFVGSFTYTDPGCRDEPFGNEYLTAANAPRIAISPNGAFSGSRTHKGGISITDKISGRFDARSASATFEESETCKGDKPLKLSFPMHAT